MANTNHHAGAITQPPEPYREQVSDEELEEENEGWEDWEEEGDDDMGSNFLCLFCESNHSSCEDLFEHCCLTHKFDFHGMRKALNLGFYGSFKLINYVRYQVAENRCWGCGLAFQSNRDLQSHLHEVVNFKDVKLLWDDDKYLQPFMQDDSLLYSFGEDEEGEDDYSALVETEELVKDLNNIEEMCIENANTGDTSASTSYNVKENGGEAVSNASDVKIVVKQSKGSLINLVSNDVKKVNENYFGAYSSFGIHREMLSDKVRTEAYKQAIMENPSLLKGAIVMDVGCGTGILSLFAAKAGASRVVAVEASEKMAAVATRIAKNNGLLRTNTQGESTGVMEVARSMIEELDQAVQIEPHSVDVLLSEWMGYCLLYESMLSSVLFARDKWLKPGGAILPDTATIFAAGFGKSGTSLPFWEDVYGFNMTCVGTELVQDAARYPLVDVLDEKDLVTAAAVLQTFDLATMKPDEVDFTASIELEPKLGSLANNSTTEAASSNTTRCYGVVLWFDTGFTSRFCKENPANLSTSPYTPRTHWSQTVLTFEEPIAIAPSDLSSDKSAAVGSDACPAAKMHLRISIARAVEHRCIDISIEATGVGHDGRKRGWPVQIFTLT